MYQVRALAVLLGDMMAPISTSAEKKACVLG